MDYAFMYAESHPMDLEEDYDYTARKGSCRSSEYKGVFSPSGYHDVRRDSPSQLMAALDRAVVSVAIEADRRIFQSYRSGVISSGQCGTHLDHGVTAVGYNSEAFIVKNSWGEDWGMNGYVQISTSSSNICGILSQPSYPTA